MKESEFNALIRLLEDEDPEVSRHVEAELMAMGGEGIPRLEAAWESEANKVIQGRLEDIIHGIQNIDTLQELQEWYNDEEHDLLYAWFLVSRYQYPNLEFITFKNKVNRLVNRTWLEFRRGMDPGEKLMVLNRMLFEKEQFLPNQRVPLHPDNLFINTFFEKRKGIPISLGLLYIIICRHLDIPVAGIALPGYFLIHFQDDRFEYILDVFHQGNIVSRDQVKEYLTKHGLEDDPKYYQGGPDPLVLLELIDRIIETYKNLQEPEKEESFERLREILRREWGE